MTAVTLGSMVSETIEIEIMSVATGQVLSPASSQKPLIVTQEVTTELAPDAIRPLVAVVEQGTQAERTYLVADADYASRFECGAFSTNCDCDYSHNGHHTDLVMAKPIYKMRPANSLGPQLVANNATDLWDGSIGAAIVYDQDGNTNTTQSIATATAATGLKAGSGY